MLDIISSVGINYSNPVIAQMMPGSSFLADINSGVNLARESAQVPSRIGIVSVAHNFYWGGPLRAAFPDDGDLWATWRDITMTGLDYFAFYVWTNAPFGDPRSMDIANALWTASGWLGSMDEWWCQAVSMAGYGTCWANDTVVPEWSQDYGALGGLSIHTGWDGPAHTQETRMGDYLIDYALTNFASVPRRQAPPPAPATPTLSINRQQFCSSDTDWVASITTAPRNSSAYLYEERWVNDHWVYNWEGSVGYTDGDGQLTITASPPITGPGWYRSWVVVAGASSNPVEYEVVC
jgi:hypothetical protein